MTTIDKLANELFPCPSNCPSKQMTAKYMRENFKQSVNMVADEIRRVNGAHRVKVNFGPSFASGGIVYGHPMAVTGRDEGPEYILTDEQLEKIGIPRGEYMAAYDKLATHSKITVKGVALEKILRDEASGEK